MFVIYSLVCVKRRVFSKKELILSQIILVTSMEWLVLRNKINYTQANAGAKVPPHTHSVLIVFPTQMLKYLRCVWDCGVCGNKKESTS